MFIGGLQKTSLIDYPDKISAVIFTAGCNFRCPYCHNPELVTKIDRNNFIPPEKVFDFLSRRLNILEAVVITGGEPTIQSDLPAFIKKIKKMNFLIKLDTNGSQPAMLEKIINQKIVDYIAMDIKSPLPKYAKTVKIKISTQKIKKSIELIKKSGLDYEFRSTLLPAFHTSADVVSMAKLVQGAKKYFLQKFLPAQNLNNNQFKNFKSFSHEDMLSLVKLCQQYVENCQLR